MTVRLNDEGTVRQHQTIDSIVTDRICNLPHSSEQIDFEIGSNFVGYEGSTEAYVVLHREYIGGTF